LYSSAASTICSNTLARRVSEKVHKQRDLGRKSRLKNELPMIALAGYTNAGKSTLFNTLTQAEVFADEQLFATLDATIRRVIFRDLVSLNIKNNILYLLNFF
jgi:50S ribosomal subunit-associated GTPase HflX